MNRMSKVGIMIRRTLLLAAVLLSLVPGLASGAVISPDQTVLEDDTINVSDYALAWFGNSMAVSGRHAIIGAYGTELPGKVDAGKAVIYEWVNGTWVKRDELVSLDINGLDYFGEAVAISGDYAVIGVPRDKDIDYQGGSAYVFRRQSATSWYQVAKLTASDAGYKKYFGTSVAISGDNIMVGTGSEGTQQAYYFKKPLTGWTSMTETQKLVSGSGDSMLVAMGGDNLVTRSANKVKFYTHNGSSWSLKKSLTASQTTDLMNRRGMIAISESGNTALVGEDGESRVFEFNGSSWSEAATLTGCNRGLAVSDTMAVAGCPATIDTELFHRTATGWVSSTADDIVKPSSSTHSELGGRSASVAVANGAALVGTTATKVGSGPGDVWEIGVVRFYEAGSAPEAPTLTAPADNSALDASTIPLSWDPVNDALAYRLQVADNENMTSPFINADMGTSTSATLNTTPNGATTYWRVLSQNCVGLTPSATWSYTNGTPPDAPTLLLPSDAAEMLLPDVQFSWNPVSGTNIEYRLQISKEDQTFTTLPLTIDAAITQSAVTVTNLEINNVTYYWRVMSRINGGPWSEASEIRYFVLDGPPVLLSPANGSTESGTSVTFSWTPYPGATRYYYQLATSVDFNSASLLLNGFVEQNPIFFNGFPLNGTRYYWRVLAVDGSTAISGWSNTWSFISQ